MSTAKTAAEIAAAALAASGALAAVTAIGSAKLSRAQGHDTEKEQHDIDAWEKDR